MAARSRSFRRTDDLKFQADSWDGPYFRPFACGLNDFATSPPPHAMFMDAMEPLGVWEFVISGAIYYKLGNERHRVEAGEALVTRRPDPGWMLRPVEGVRVQTLWIEVAGESALRMFDFLHLKYGQIQRFPLNGTVVRLARELVRLAAARPRRPAHFWSQRTFLWLNAWWEYAHRHLGGPRRVHLKAIQPSRLISYAPKTFKNFASEVGYSRAYLARKLAQQWKKPPGQVLREVRMADAAKLLRTTRLNVSEVAEKVGYASTAGFCRAFRGHYRQTPRRYRLTHA